MQSVLGNLPAVTLTLGAVLVESDQKELCANDFPPVDVPRHGRVRGLAAKFQRSVLELEIVCGAYMISYST